MEAILCKLASQLGTKIFKFDVCCYILTTSRVHIIHFHCTDSDMAKVWVLSVLCSLCFIGLCSSQKGKVYRDGEFTYYDQVGLGSCGTKLKESQLTVALGIDHWNQKPVANPNLHPLCQQCVCARYKDRVVKARIRDKCWSCGWLNLDLSRKAFKRLEPNLDFGRVKGVSFKVIPCSEKCKAATKKGK